LKLTIPQLKTKIKLSEFAGAFLFYGEERYILNSYTEQIKAKTITDFPEFNLLEINEENADFEQFYSFVCAYPQFSNKKLVVARNCGFLQNSTYKEKLAQLFSDIPQFCVVIFIEDSISKISKDVMSAFEKHGNITDFVKQNPADLRAWVNKTFAAAKKRMTIEDMSYLVDVCSQSLEKLDVECSKLIAATEEEVISKTMIDNLVTVPTEYKIFAMSDYLLNKKADDAYMLLKEFRINKEQPTEIIALIYAAVADIYMFKVLMSQGENPDNYLAPNRKWLSKKYRAMAPKFEFKKLRGIMKLCYKYDEKIKTGSIDAFTALELVMAKML